MMMTTAPSGATRWQWFLLLPTLLVLAVAVLLQPQQTWQDERVRLSLGTEHYLVDAADLVQLETVTQRHFGAAEARMQAQLQATLASHMDTFFGGAEARIPEFLDWYYSSSGEYTRIAMSALGWVGLADNNYLANQALQRLLPDAQWQQQMTALQATLLEAFETEQQVMRQGWLADVSALLAARRVPGPLAGVADERPVINLDAISLQWFEGEREALRMRMQGSTLGSALAVAAMRQVAARGAAARVAGRSVARAGSAGLSAAAACAPGGALAVGCAVAVGAGTWLLGDLLLLRVDEAFNREAMHAQLVESLHQLRRTTEAELLAANESELAAFHQASRTQISEGFRPLRH